MTTHTPQGTVGSVSELPPRSYTDAEPIDLQPPATPASTVMLTAQDVCALADVSYRMLDFWLRCEYVSCDNDARGSGSRRRFTLPQLRRVLLLAWLTKGGLTPQQAVALLDGDTTFLLAAFPGGAT